MTIDSETADRPVCVTGVEGQPMSLNQELQVYRLQLIDMLGVNDVNEGKYVVIKGMDVLGMFETYESALDFGYDRCGLTPFLVKRIERNESILYFSRPV
jgi:hypothetical protein